MAANEVPIDLVMRARDEMSAVLDRVVRESDALAISFDDLGKESAQQATDFSRIIPISERLANAFDITGKRAKDASGITWDATVNRWRDANNKFISTQEATNRGFKEADKEVYKYKRAADDAASSTTKLGQSMDGANKSSGLFKAGIVAVGNVAADLAMKALSAVGSAVGDVASAMINGNAEFERYTVQFGVLLGGADNAKKRLAELAEFGAKTPFELPEVVRADKILQSFGLHSEDAAKKFGFSGTQIRTIAGDLAAGTGQNFEDMTRYLGMFASGATGEAISRFQELGITTREELGKMGLEFSKSGELTTPTQEAFNVLLTVAQKKFGGMMDAQSKTFEGMVSNLEDWKGQTLRLIGEPIFEVLRDKLGVVLEFLNRPETQRAIMNFADGIADALGKTIDWVERNWPVIEAVVTEVFNALKFGYNYILKPTINFVVGLFEMLVGNAEQNFGEMSSTISNVMNGIQRIIDTVLAAVWRIWEDNGSEIMDFVRETWGTISDIVNGAVAVILRVIEVSMPQIEATIDKYLTAAKVVFEVAWAAIKIVVGTALDLIKGVIDTILKLINGDTEGALNALRNTFFSIWTRIYNTVSEAIADVKRIIDEYLAKSGTSVDSIMNGIRDSIVRTWTTITNDVDWWVGTIKNRTSAYFQEMRDNITLAFNQTVDNIRSALQRAINAYNTVAPFLGYPMIPNLATTASRGSNASTASRSTTFNITANYGYQDERSLREDVRTLQMLYGGA